MRRLFLRTYGALALVVVAGLLVAGAWGAAQRRPADPEVVDALVRGADVVREAFGSADPDDARGRVAKELRAGVDVLPLDPLPPLPPGAQHRLRRGQSVGPRPGGRPELWVPLPDRGLLVHVVPPGPRPPPVPWIAAVVLLGLGAAMAWQLLPLQRDLALLADAAGRFGAGDRDVRVQLDPRTAAGELGSRFDAMADRIAGLLDAREELLLAVSHELRTPLNRVRFAAELLAGEPDAAARATQAEALHRDLDELDALVEELLAFGRLEQGGLTRSDVAVAPLVAELLEGASRLREGLQTVQEVADGLTVSADRTLLRRAVSSVVANAARYGGGRVQVSAEVLGDRVALHVDDDGPGIPEAARERVLEPFVRLDVARDRDAGGVGLGLALADRTLRAHGGTLVVGDSPLGGARVTLTLPLTVADTA